MNCCQILTKEQFDFLFKKLSETENKNLKTDSVYNWYMHDGMKKLRNIEFSDYISKKWLGHSAPDGNYGNFGDNDDFDDWLSKMDDIDDIGFQNAAKEFIKTELNCNDLVFVGQGSEKVALVDKAGHALKFGRFGGTLKREIRTGLKYSDLKCFPTIYAYDPQFYSYMCECARESTTDDFKKLTGFESAAKLVSFLRHSSLAEIQIQLTQACNRSSELIKSISDLKLFLDKDDKGLSDIDENNWGFTFRNYQPTLIVIDFDL